MGESLQPDLAGDRLFDATQQLVLIPESPERILFAGCLRIALCP